MNEKPRELYGAIARLQDEERARIPFEANLGALLEVVGGARQPKPRRAPLWLVWSSAVATSVGLTLGILWTLGAFAPAPELAPQLAPSPQLETPPATPDVLTATAGMVVQPVGPAQTLVFADQTQLIVASGAHLSVIGEAQVTLHSGTLSFAGAHRANNGWLLKAGPYEVSVLGTQFEMHWQPEAERLTVIVSQGSVRVSGPGGAQVVAAGHDWASGEQTAATADPDRTTEPTAAEADPTQAPSEPVASSIGEQARSPDPKKKPTPPRAPDWKALYERGDYVAALAVVEELGSESLLKKLSADELTMLADTARFAQDISLASTALKRLRTRFAGGTQARLAAYTLGQIAGDDDEASRWFETYLEEAPEGELRREAMGRLLELHTRTKSDKARALAKAYLNTYPHGPHAPLARRLLEAEKGVE